MKKLSGFSLMEMMVVLLIISIVAAASAPMVNKKLLGAAAEKSPWVWTGVNNNIAYNLNNAMQTASIGTTNPPAAASNAKLYIDTKASGGVYRPQIAFGQDDGKNVMRLTAAKNSIWLTNTPVNYSANTVVIGGSANAYGLDSTAIGYNAKTYRNYATALGRSANASGLDSIAIGNCTSSSNTNTIALGNYANASGSNSTALGNYARASSGNSIALGNYANASGSNSTALGNYARASSGNSIALGNYANAFGISSTALGDYARASSGNSIALGSGSNASGSSSTALGSGSKASGWSSIALGETAYATGTDSTALGYYARAEYSRSTAIGRNARTTASNQIMLGTKDDTVVVPGTIEFENLHVTGTLVVDQDTVLCRKGGEFIFRTQPGPPDENSKYSSSELSRIFMGDDKGGDDNTRTLRKYGWTYTIQGFTISSDRRLKDIGKVFSSGLDKIRKLEVFNYTFKDDMSKTPHVGVMAQDLQKIFPDAVIKGEDGFLKIRMEDMFYALVNAVKENDSRITALEKENQELKKQNQEFEKRIANLEKKIK